MDAFGIFELLDTLSRLAAQENTPKTKDTAPQAKRTPSSDDQAFAPPDFSGAGAPSESGQTKRAALDSLYERHDKISKRIDEKK